MDRPNFYILLDLDPSMSDNSRIAEAIARKKKEWNAMRNNSLQGPDAVKKLGMLRDIEQVMMTENSRHQEAEEARREINAKKREAAKELDRTIRVLAAKGYVLEEELADLVTKHKTGFNESEIRARIQVRMLTDAQTRPKPKPLMEKSIFDLICSCLLRINQANLYEFLKTSDTTSRETLLEETRKLDSDERKKKITSDVTDRLKACGFCLSVFGTEASRIAYDNTLVQKNLQSLDSILHTAGQKQKGFKAEVVEELILLALEKRIDKDEAIAYILNFAITKNWSIVLPQQTAAERLQPCGNCGVLNEENHSVCGHCGSPLKITCPKCGTVNASKRRACSNGSCGFTVGDYFLVLRWLRDAELALARDEFSVATPLLRQANALWPGEKKVASLLAKITQRQEQIDRCHQELLNLVRDRRYEEAERQMAAFCRLVSDHPDRYRLAKEIEAARATARQHVQTGQQFERAGDIDNALDAYQLALSACADCAEAQAVFGRCPPTPPSHLQLSIEPAGVSLRWLASNARGQIQYRVQRKTDSPSKQPADGETLGETAAASFLDTSAKPGEFYYYAVFANRGGVYSPAGTGAGPILRVADVANLQSLERDSLVEISWTAPSGSHGVEVWRKAGMPPSCRGDGERLNIGDARARSVVDAGLTNGRIYGYRICVIFRDAAGCPVFTEGVTFTATPAEIPQPILDLIAAPTNDGFEATWSLPSRGQVWLYHSERKPIATLGKLLSIAELGTLGARVAPLEPGKAGGPVNGDRSQYRYLTPVTVNGSTAMVGQVTKLSWIQDVGELGVFQEGDFLAVRWRWPAGIESVRVIWRRDRFADGPHDRAAIGHEDLTHHHYSQQGAFRLQRPELAHLYLTVFAKIREEQGWQFAPGAPGARKHVPLEMCASLNYSVSAGGFFRSDATLTITPGKSMRLPALVLVVKSGAMPTDLNDGTQVVQLAAGEVCSPSHPLKRNFPTERLPTRWKARLFPADSELGQWLDLSQQL